LLKGSHFDTVIPELYQLMQIKDVMEALASVFDLELDIEYDDVGGWSANRSYQSARSYLFRFLNDGSSKDGKNNTIIFDLNDINDCGGQSILDKFSEILQEIPEKRLTNQVNIEEGWYKVAIKDNNSKLHLHEFCFQEQFLVDLGVKYQKSFVG